jgi:hypothetical protein
MSKLIEAECGLAPAISDFSRCLTWGVFTQPRSKTDLKPRKLNVCSSLNSGQGDSYVRFVPILLQKSFYIIEHKFSGL